MVRVNIPHYGTTEQVDVPRVSRKNTVSLQARAMHLRYHGSICDLAFEYMFMSTDMVFLVFEQIELI
jgi:hypothetical protein